MKEKRARETTNPGDLDELTVFGLSKIGVGKRGHEAEERGFGCEASSVPENERDDERREQRESDEERGVSDGDEDED